MRSHQRNRRPGRPGHHPGRREADADRVRTAVAGSSAGRALWRCTPVRSATTSCRWPSGALRRTDISTFVVDLTPKQLATATVVTLYRILAMILRSAVTTGCWSPAPARSQAARYAVPAAAGLHRRLSWDPAGACAAARLRRPRTRRRHRHAKARCSDCRCRTCGCWPTSCRSSSGAGWCPVDRRRSRGTRDDRQPPGPAAPPVRRHGARAAHRAVGREA